MKIVLLSGWHEADEHLDVFENGRHGIGGLRSHGFDCAIFPHGRDDLRPRIDRFAGFLEELKACEPEAFPVATFGYSTGGLVNRGFLRAYPERAGDIAATIQLASPNAGLVSEYFAATLRVMRVPSGVIDDIDVASPFLTWLNETSGHWVPTENPRVKRWVLDRAPWVVPPGHRVLAIAGLVPRYRDQSDGVVRLDSATLEGRMPHVVIADGQANHLNIGATGNTLTRIFRGWRTTDDLWPRVIEITARFAKGGSV